MSIGQLPHRAFIANVTNSLPCKVYTTEEHGYVTGDFVRITDLNSYMPIPRGEDPINNYRFKIIVTGDDEFDLYDPITFVPIDSTNFPPYVEGGNVNLITHEYIYYGEP